MFLRVWSTVFSPGVVCDRRMVFDRVSVLRQIIRGEVSSNLLGTTVVCSPSRAAATLKVRYEIIRQMATPRQSAAQMQRAVIVLTDITHDPFVRSNKGSERSNPSRLVTISDRFQFQRCSLTKLRALGTSVYSAGTRLL